MKNIVILSPAHPLRGGIAAVSERLALALQEDGYQVTIYSFSLQYPDFLFPGKTQYASGPPPKKLNIKTVVNSINPVNWIKVGLELKRLQPDIIISRYWLPFMGPSLGTILKIAKSNRHTKVLALVDNAIPHEKRPGDTWFTRYFVSACHGFVVMSKSVGEDIQQFTETKPILFNPHPLYDNYGPLIDKGSARRKLKLQPDEKYLLFFGFIRDYKGLDILLRAMADQRVQALNIKLIIAGEYYGKQAFYESLMEELNITDRIVAHTEFIPNDSVKYYFGAADLVVQPYRSATQSGISQLAYHFEKPMVVTRVGGLPEIVPDGKVGFVTDISAEAIVNAIIKFYQDQLESIFIKNIQQRKPLFSWKKMVETIEELAEAVSNEQRSNK